MRIGLSYIEGKGVEQDEPEGYTWLFVAAANGWEGVENLEKSVGEFLEAESIKRCQQQAHHGIKGNADLAGDNDIPPTEEDQPPSEGRVASAR